MIILFSYLHIIYLRQFTTNVSETRPSGVIRRPTVIKLLNLRNTLNIKGVHPIRKIYYLLCLKEIVFIDYNHNKKKNFFESFCLFIYKSYKDVCLPM